MSTGSTNFAYESGDRIKRTYSDNTQFKLAFNPGAAVYIFPNVCATLSFGLGGIQYTSVTQKDAEGHKIGSRKASNMKFKLNIAAINVGMTIHLWDKKKEIDHEYPIPENAAHGGGRPSGLGLHRERRALSRRRNQHRRHRRRGIHGRRDRSREPHDHPRPSTSRPIYGKYASTRWTTT